MHHFLFILSYSYRASDEPFDDPDERRAAASTVLESFGGELQRVHWDVDTSSAVILAGLPDSVTAAAIVAAAGRTGDFRNVEVHEVLTPDQFSDMVVLAEDASNAYRAPGEVPGVSAEPDV